MHAHTAHGTVERRAAAYHRQAGKRLEQSGAWAFDGVSHARARRLDLVFSATYLASAIHVAAIPLVLAI